MYLINAFNSNAIDRTPPQTPFWTKLQMARLFAKPTYKVHDKKESCTVIACFIRLRNYCTPIYRVESKCVMRSVPTKSLQHNVAVRESTKFTILQYSLWCLRRKPKTVSPYLIHQNCKVFRQ